MSDARQPRHSTGYLEGLARLIGQIPAQIWTTDTGLRLTSSDGRGLAAIGLKPGDNVGRTLYEILETTEPVAPIPEHLRALAGEHVTYETVYLGRTFASQVVPLLDPAGAIEGCLGLAVDMTEVSRAIDGQRRSEAHYRALVDNAPVGIFRSSAAGRFITVNPALVAMLGYDSADELRGLDLAADVYVDPALRDKLTSQYGKETRVAGVEVDWRRKDGTRIMVRLSGQPVRSAQGAVEAWEMVAEDVTERRRLEAQLRTAHKMEALGLVTGGVAHDFNNLLTTILANAELIAEALPASLTQISSDLLEIRDAASRGGDLVKKLLGFSRRERLSMQPTDVGGVVEEMAAVLRSLVPDRIGVAMHVEEGLPPVLADAGALQQILVSLATNARDAIAGNGTISLSAMRARLDAAHIAEFGWGTVGDFVAIRVQDTGLGMDEDTRARVFEPFFTTKPPGAGSGLGLAMVYGLMKQQNGFVGIVSRPQQGTAVTLYLPLAGRRTPVPVKAEPVRVSGEYILVVEDEEPIRRVARRVLERHGFRVLTAADGVEALAIYRDNESNVALILTDMIMPRMGGRALQEALHGAGKQVPMIFMTGFAARGDHGTASIDAGMPVLAKPWTVEQLVAKVKETMGTSQR